MRSIILAATIAATASIANAQEATDTTSLADTFATICAAYEAGNVNLSDDAGFACYKGEMPDTVTDGSRWVSRSVGVEFTTLARNIELLAVGE